jgi:imidazolonepropionase-like amidohydrolase
VGATVFDGTGAPPILDAVIIVSDGRIEEIGPPDLVKVPARALELRLDGRWVIPGLIDAHVHLESWSLARFLAYGVTSVRALGGDHDQVVALRDSVLLGALPGPRVYISGPMVDGRPATWPGATEVQNANAARRAVDDRVLIGAAQVKVYTKLNRRLLEPLVDEATALQIPVAAHLGKVDALTAAQLGVRSLEHMSGVVEATLADPTRLYRAHDDFFAGWKMFERSWVTLDSADQHRVARALAATDVTVVPTLVLHEAYGHLDDGEYIAQLDLAGVPQSVREAWDIPDLIERAGISSRDFTVFRSSRPAQDRFLRLFRRAGGAVAAGTDAPNQLLAPGASLHRELELLVAAGLSNEEALLAATREAATVLNSDSIGVLKAGASADLLVLDGDPLADIANVRLIERIVLRGVSFHPDEFKSDWEG